MKKNLSKKQREIYDYMINWLGGRKNFYENNKNDIIFINMVTEKFYTKKFYKRGQKTVISVLNIIKYERGKTTMKKEFKKVSLLNTLNYYEMLLEDEKEYILENFEEFKEQSNKSLAEIKSMKPYDVIQEFDRENDLSYDSTEIYFDDEKEVSLSIIKKIISMYEKQYHTKIAGFLLLAYRSSRYGAIGGNGATGYKWLDNLDEIFSVECDDMTIEIDKNQKICINYYDHDGSNDTELRLVPGGVFDKLEEQDSYDVEENIYSLYKNKGGNVFSKTILNKIVDNY